MRFNVYKDDVLMVGVGYLTSQGHYFSSKKYHFIDYTKTKEISHQIRNFDGGEVEQFSVKALNDLMTLDSNYREQTIENTYKYITLKGNHAYVETISRDYKPQLDFFKLDKKTIKQ